MRNRFLSQNQRYLQKPKIIINLQWKLIVLFSMLICGVLLLMGTFLHYLLAETLEEQIGNQALSVAKSVANIPELVAAFQEDDPSSVIQGIVMPIKQTTGAEFIVVGNKEEIRLSHPDSTKIGLRMVGEDNQRALLYGESYISKATGSLGQSIRGKVPIILQNGEIIGVVSVGFLMENVNGIIKSYRYELWLLLIIIGVIGIAGAVLIASYIKKVLFGLEPEEISHLLLQKESILQSTHEGIVAVNQKGNITLMNMAAQHLLFEKENNQCIGMPINKVLPVSKLPEVLTYGKSQFNQELVIGSKSLLVNRVPIYHEKSLIGAVATFRDKTEIENLTSELSRVKQYAEGLRAQTHEFSNKLSTILGLLHLDKKQEAMEFIKKEHHLQQDWIHMIIERISDPFISAILLGKIAQASEQHVRMTIHPDSQMNEKISPSIREPLVTTIGNLLDNAMDAVKDKAEEERVVSIFFTTIGEEILFEIEDSGDGVSPNIMNQIFDFGFSTKDGSHRGVGLALSNQLITSVNGNIFLEESESGGACFVITVPKGEGNNSEK